MKLFVRVVLLALAYFFPIAAAATYVYNTITYPGAVHTEVRGINNAGQLVGYASLDGTSFFGFTYQSGAFTALPPTLYPVAGHGINDAGIVVGTANFSPTTPGIGFIFNAGTYAFFSRPGWDTTFARAIGPTNLITGYSENPTGDTAGYIYDPIAGTYTDISPPGSLLTIAQGINAAGQVVGSAILSPGGAHAFLREPGGAITLFQIGSSRTYARGINDTGLIAGFTSPPASATAQSFVGSSGGFQTLMVPGSDDTFAEGINNAGQVAGLYHAGGVAFGFIATPASMPTGTTSGGAYTFSVAVIPNFPIFIDPPVAVGYDYATGNGDPNFASVRLPIGVGDSFYRVKVRGRKFTLAGGELLDFRAAGFPDGVDAFRVGCIEVAAGLDPANAEAFPTELTFVAAGTFTGTMKPLTRNSAARGTGNCDVE